MPGITRPENYPIRDPRDYKQVQGRIVNPVRGMELSGFTKPGNWPAGNTMKVEKPTNVKGAKSSAERKGG